MRGFFGTLVCSLLAALLLAGCSGGEDSLHPKYRSSYRSCLEFLKQGSLAEQAQKVDTKEVHVRDLGWEERDVITRLEDGELQWDGLYWVFVLGDEETGTLELVCDSQTHQVVGYLE